MERKTPVLGDLLKIAFGFGYDSRVYKIPETKKEIFMVLRVNEYDTFKYKLDIMSVKGVFIRDFLIETDTWGFHHWEII